MTKYAHPNYDLIDKRSGKNWGRRVRVEEAAAVAEFLSEAWDIETSLTRYDRESVCPRTGETVRVYACNPMPGRHYPRVWYAAVFSDGHVEDWTRPLEPGWAYNPDGYEPRARWLY